MKRKIAGFHPDDQLDWVADLVCGHCQHMRHNPPWMERAWVTTVEGRKAHLGTEVDCVLCDSREIPERATFVRKTEVFTENTIPDGLRKQHKTTEGVWGKLSLIEGHLKYMIFEPYNEKQLLGCEHPGIILPDVPHAVEPIGNVQFYLEFFKVAKTPV